MKKWTVLSPESDSVNKILSSTDLLPLTASVMSARGYKDVESLARFFDLEELSDPFELLDMDKAVEIINNAIESGEHICVYGDYDCDGVTSTAILCDYLMNMGANVSSYIPERAEGYGLNKQAIEKLSSDEVSLIITVDNGITAIEEAKYIRSLGMKLVITDHHQPSDEIPEADAVVDPHRQGCPSAFKELAGVGVALKLLAALDGGSYDMVLEQYGDIVAIGTVADVVPLVSENRTIVSKGIDLLKNTENIGLLSLLDDSGADMDKISSSTIAFALAPRLNAAGRFGSPSVALKTLAAEDESAAEYAGELSRLNDMRKKEEEKIEAQIAKKLSENPDIAVSRVMVISGEGWHHGVIGIVAARLLEEYEKPVVIISIDPDGTARGSARSIKGFNIFKCFEYCRELLDKFGGHECAGGLTIRRENIQRFNELVQQFAAQNYVNMPKYTLTIDRLAAPNELTIASIKDLKRLEPYGAGNLEPVFAFSGALVRGVTPLKNGEHTRLDVSYGGVSFKALLFRKKTANLDIKVGDTIDIAGTLNVNSFRGVESISVIVSDFRLHGIKQGSFLAAQDAYEAFKRREYQPKEVLKKGLPTRQELVSVYKFIAGSRSVQNIETLYARLHEKGLNAFKLNIILDVFTDTKLIETSGAKRTVKLLKPEKKVDILSSETLIRLNGIVR